MACRRRYVRIAATKQDKPDRGAAMLKFFDWVYANDGQAADALDYIPLPEAVVTEVRT